MHPQSISSSTERKTVLIADDDPINLNIVKAAIECCSPNLSVLTAENGREATQALEREHIDLVATDVNMPDADGLQVLSHAVNRRLLIPAIAFTSGCSSKQRRGLLKCGAFRVLDKPLNLNELMEAASSLLASPVQAFPDGFALAGILQLVESEQKSCDIVVRSTEALSGDLIFIDGELVHAKTDDQIGDEAAKEILSWPGCAAEIRETTLLHPTTVRSSLGQLLLGSITAPRRDEDSGSESLRIGDRPSRSALIDALFQELSRLPGFISAAAVDLSLYRMLQTRISPSAGINPLELDAQVMAICRMIEAQRGLGGTAGSVEVADMVLRLKGTWHLIRSLGPATALHLTLDAAVMARPKLSRWLADACNRAARGPRVQ